MSFTLRVSFCFLALSLCPISTALAQSQSSSSIPNSSQSAAEPAMRALVEKYFALYAAKDLDGVMSLWSERSPDYASFKENLQRQFTAEDFGFSLPAISRLKVEGGKASLRATMNLTAVILKSAGVPATVVSQWKVESASTRDLMLSFHRQVRAPAASAKSKMTKAEALRQAALKVMKNPETGHPFYWAGFVLVGDGF